MKAKELEKTKALSVEDLQKKLQDLKKDLFMLRMQHATNQLDNPMQIAAVKKDIAQIKTIIRHPLYKKTLKRTYKLKAHDEENACGIGDTVEVMETRPLSKDKRWRLVRIIEKAK